MFGYSRKKEQAYPIFPDTGISSTEMKDEGKDVLNDVFVEPAEMVVEAFKEICSMCGNAFEVVAGAITDLEKHICPKCMPNVKKQLEDTGEFVEKETEVGLEMNVDQKRSDWQPHLISQATVANLEKYSREGKHIGAHNLGDIVYTNEIKRHTPENARKIAYGVIGKQYENSGRHSTDHMRELG